MLNCPTLPLLSQVSEQFEMIGIDLTAGIEKDYGKNENLTSAWSTVMDKVRNLRCNFPTDLSL